MIPLDKKFTVIDDGGLGVWDAGDDYDPIPPRKWLLGNTFCRTFLSSLISTGGVGKTALRIAQALSLATGRELTEEYVFRRARVLYVSLEDDRDELRRRVKAAMLHYGIKHADVKGWLFLSSITGSGWKLNSDSGWKLSSLEYRDGQAAGQLTHRLKREIETPKIDLVILDPFIKAHCAEENDNTAIDQVAAIAAKIAIDHDCAIDVPHHTSKMFAEPGNANAGRGASSFKDAGRLTYTLTPMSMDEAKQFNLSEEERRSLVRVDSAKVNLVRASTSAAWFRLASVNLGNGTEEYPAGDNIQVAEPWVPPDMWRDLSPSLCCALSTSSKPA